MLIPSLLLSLLAQSGAGGAESRFHRVHLRNGNFIDGELVRQNAKEIVLRLKSGEMGVRRDQIVRIELVKMRGIQDKPEEVVPPKPPPLAVDAPAEAPKTPAAARPPAEGAYKASPALKAKVDPLLEKLEKAAAEEVEPILRALVEMEGDAHAYLASALEVASPALLPRIGAVLSRTASREAAPYLARLLRHENPVVRLQAVTGLATNGEASDAAAVARVLRDQDAGLRAAAIVTLSAIGPADAFDAISPLSADPDGETRGRALQALASLATKYGLKEELQRTLSDALQGAALTMAADLIGALANTRDERACALLAPYLTSERADVRGAAAAGLARIGSPEAADDIAARVGVEEDVKVRLALADAAVHVKARDAMAGLAAWLEDDNELVKKAAHAALRSLSRTDLGLDRAAWEDWIERNVKK